MVSLLGLAVLLAAAVVGGDPHGIRERLFAGSSPVASSVGAVQPWQDVVSLHGSGSEASAPFAIDHAAREWRVRWSCGAGHLLIRAAAGAAPIVDAPCPASGTGFGSGTGPTTLRVTADGSWDLAVQQHLTVRKASM
ncbi:MAG TPA: hypothetical protein VHT75_18930 [Acidimicrobiales bacterium]|nr:hypothetical protein [Acidimicrobiales bacterium]